MTRQFRTTSVAFLAALVAAFTLFLGAVPAFAIVNVSADGPFFQVTGKPGETLQLVVQLGNHGAAPLVVRTYPADAYSIITGDLPPDSTVRPPTAQRSGLATRLRRSHWRLAPESRARSL
jgi:hypothetical protein